MDHHLPRADGGGRLDGERHARRDQGAQFGVLVVDVEALVGAVDFRRGLRAPREGGSSRRDAVLAFEGEGGMAGEVLYLDVAGVVEEPVAVLCDSAAARAARI